MILDFALAIVVLLGLMRGFKKGFASQMVGVAALVLSFLFAEKLGDWAQPRLGSLLSESIDPATKSSLFAAGALVVIWIAIKAAGSLYLYVYRTRGFGVNAPSLQDRVLGLFLGVVLGSFVVNLLLYSVSLLPSGVRENDLVKEQLDNSRLARLCAAYPVAERVIQTKEAQNMFGHLGNVVAYLRSSSETGDSLRQQPSGDRPGV